MCEIGSLSPRGWGRGLRSPPRRCWAGWRRPCSGGTCRPAWSRYNHGPGYCDVFVRTADQAPGSLSRDSHPQSHHCPLSSTGRWCHQLISNTENLQQLLKYPIIYYPYFLLLYFYCSLLSLVVGGRPQCKLFGGRPWTIHYQNELLGWSYFGVGTFVCIKFGYW